MPQAWNCRLTQFQQKAFKTLYGDARVREGVFTKIYQLLIGSKAEGTVKCYIASIQRFFLQFFFISSYRTIMLFVIL